MRGPKYRRQPRAGNALPSPNEAVGKPVLLPAPLGGWNSGPLSMMRPQDAFVMDNFYPAVGEVTLRKGSTPWATGLTGWVRGMLKYTSPTVLSLFASTDAGIYDVSAAGAVGAAVTVCTNGYWQFDNMTTSGGSFLLCVNGVDNAKRYDGATWINAAITGVTTTSLGNITVFKRRFWFVQNNTLDAWYLPVDSIAGAATKFPFGPVFRKGGYLVAQFNWTLDGGTGLDDYLVTVTSEGQMAVFQGTDPTSATTFALVGVYDVGPPLGKRCFMKYGGDVLYLSRYGVFPLSKMLFSAFPDRTTALSSKIDEAFREATSAYGQYEGWEALIFPEINAVIINVPIAPENIYYQFVMNDLTKAWSRFTNWNFHSFSFFDNALWGGGNGTVSRLWGGATDNGELISATAAQAYNSFGTSYQKQPQLVRPILRISGVATVLHRFDADFSETEDSSQFSYSSNGNLSLWDVALWDVGVWEGTANDIKSSWSAVTAPVGFVHSYRVQMYSGSSELGWIASYIINSPAGLL